VLITFTSVISCENPRCREFARIVTGIEGAKSYYCPVCGAISPARTVNADLAALPERYESYLRRKLQPPETADG